MESVEDKTENKYEISFLGQAETSYEAVLELVKKYGATVLNQNRPQRVRFFYPIKKENFGFLNQITFNSGPEKIEEIKRELGLNTQSLRFMIARVPPIDVRQDADKKDRTTIWRREEDSAARQAREQFRVTGDRPRRPEPSKSFDGGTERELSNEALEKKLEEILGG